MSIDEEKAGRYLDEIRSLHAECDTLRASVQRLTEERQREIDRFQMVLTNIHGILTGELCDPSISIGLTTSAASRVVARESSARELLAKVEGEAAALVTMIEAARQLAVADIKADKPLDPHEINVALSPWEVKKIAPLGASMAARLKASEAVCEIAREMELRATGKALHPTAEQWQRLIAALAAYDATIKEESAT